MCRRRRTGFTLVEMLIVMAIITLISSMLVVMLAGAHQDSNKLRTAAQVRRIDSLIQEQWEELQYKPIRLLPARLTFLNLPANANNLQLARGMRLQGIRELYRMELPDRIQDIANDPAFIDYDDAVHARDGGQPVGNGNHRLVLHQDFQRVLNGGLDF